MIEIKLTKEQTERASRGESVVIVLENAPTTPSVSVKKQWRPREGGYLCSARGRVVESDDTLVNGQTAPFDTEMTDHGSVRGFKNQAEQLAAFQRRFNRLHVWLCENTTANNISMKPDKSSGVSYCVYWNHFESKFRVLEVVSYAVTELFTTELVAEKLALALNSGEVVL